MTYRVVLTENAKANLRTYYLRAAENAPQTAIAWFNRFEKALETLSENPERCRLAAENDLVSEEIHEFLFGRRVGTFRSLFIIQGAEVLVLHIRRAAMDTASADELYGDRKDFR